MLQSYIDNWLLFAILFGLLLIVTFIMMKQSQYFYTKDPIVRKFSIMELEVPATPKELVNLIKGLYQLPPAQSQRSIAALKGQLKLDFLFMPLAYGCIFLLCWRVAHKLEIGLGYFVFIGFAFLQVVPWICDIVENNYLLGKIKPDVKDINTLKPEEQEAEKKKHKQYLWMEAAKWGISLTAAVCSISAVCYFWLTGEYSVASFRYLLIILIEIALFVAAIKFLPIKKKGLLRSLQ